MCGHKKNFNNIKVKVVNATVFVPLPYEAQEPIRGGCDCPHCKAHRDDVPMWDTLAIDPTGVLRTWVVHYPELQGSS